MVNKAQSKITEGLKLVIEGELYEVEEALEQPESDWTRRFIEGKLESTNLNLTKALIKPPYFGDEELMELQRRYHGLLIKVNQKLYATVE